MDKNEFDKEFFLIVAVGVVLWGAFIYGLFDGQHIVWGG